MSLSLAAITLFTGENGLHIVKVQSARCHYRVAVEPDCVTVYGPGVEEEFEVLFPSLSAEAQALATVLLFEEA